MIIALETPEEKAKEIKRMSGEISRTLRTATHFYDRASLAEGMPHTLVTQESGIILVYFETKFVKLAKNAINYWASYCEDYPSSSFPIRKFLHPKGLNAYTTRWMREDAPKNIHDFYPFRDKILEEETFNPSGSHTSTYFGKKFAGIAERLRIKK